MPEKQEDTKCVAVNLPVCLIQKLEEYKSKTGKNKNAILIEFIENGLNSV